MTYMGYQKQNYNLVFFIKIRGIQKVLFGTKYKMVNLGVSETKF